MDLDKLAKMSCLEVKDADREFFTNSLTGVVEIMEQIANLKTQTEDDRLTQSVTLDSLADEIISNPIHPKEKTMINRDEQYKGIHLEEGVFLAPKVIKKD